MGPLLMVVWTVMLMLFLEGDVVHVVTTYENSSQCVPKSGTDSHCVCILDGGRTYDLRNMVKGKTEPFFRTKGESANVTYYYDPCRAFSLDEDTCFNVAICRVENQTTSSTYENLGTFKNMVYNYDGSAGDLLTLEYPTDVSMGNTEVVLECNENYEDPEFQVGQKHGDRYTFIIFSSFMCDQPVQPTSSGISFGTFLCITVPIVFFCYFAFGFLYLFFVKHESWQNAVPHHQFWFSLPGLIKDGALFVWNSTIGKLQGSSSGYDQI